MELNEPKAHLRFSLMHLPVTTNYSHIRARACDWKYGDYLEGSMKILTPISFLPMNQNRENETTLGLRNNDAYISLSGASSGCV